MGERKQQKRNVARNVNKLTSLIINRQLFILLTSYRLSLNVAVAHETRAQEPSFLSLGKSKIECLFWSFAAENSVPLPSRPVTMLSYCRVSVESAGSPFINHCKCAAGFERPDVQFNRTISLI